MTPISPADPLAKSADLTAGNLGKLRELFPEAFTEGRVDFEVLKQLLGGAVDEREEKYGLNWHGKRAARRLALTPSTGTLRPGTKEESRDWDTTRNLMIEGDNLEVLKLLQKSYTGKVKLIYIDPPYNTGKDFVYPDNFHDNIANYKEITGQTEGGVAQTSRSNTESSGRFHTDWLNMMYPRLKLARNLLADDGAIYITIDDAEFANIKAMCDDVFGAENFITNIAWHKKRGKDNSAEFFSKVHDYILCYAKNCNSLIISKLELDDDTKKAYRNPDNDARGAYRTLGLWARGGQGGSRYEFTNKEGQFFSEREWLVGKEKMRNYDLENRLIAIGDKLYRKLFITENEGSIPETIWIDASNNANAADEMKELFGAQIPFDTPKPLPLLHKIIRLSASPDSLILDFFAGSGTTGHAVMAQNAADGGSRRFILVQLPEPTRTQKENGLYDTSPAWLAGYPTIAEITKSRLRRAGKKIREENPMFAGDLGFRVFKLDSTNVREWDPAPADLNNELLDHAAGRIKKDRSAADLLAELQLKLGIDLCAPAATRTLAGKTVTALGGGILYVCLADTIATDDIEPLAAGLADWHAALAPDGEPTVVFRDDAFADDIAKTNLTAILEQRGLKNIRSL